MLPEEWLEEKFGSLDSYIQAEAIILESGGKIEDGYIYYEGSNPQVLEIIDMLCGTGRYWISTPGTNFIQ